MMKFCLTCKIKKSRMWIPALGCVTAYGFFHNCIIAPYVESHIIDWTNLILTLCIIIGIGGARDVVLRRFQYLGTITPDAMQRTKGLITNKIWIPIIGWCLVGGFANNFIVYPYVGHNLVDWSGLMSALSVMLTISGAREVGIYEQKRIVDKQKTDATKTPEVKES